MILNSVVIDYNKTNVVLDFEGTLTKSEVGERIVCLNAVGWDIENLADALLRQSVEVLYLFKATEETVTELRELTDLVIKVL